MRILHILDHSPPIVVASNVGGHSELIRDRETGYLFLPNEPEALADGVVDGAGRPGWVAAYSGAGDRVHRH
jgi:glycosyltransferase involved in cell wall biosynthesis